MTTGRHVVRDITCRQCDTVVGWKYDKAYEAQEQYKENKFILEQELLVQVRGSFGEVANGELMFLGHS
jgi:hypothetical protein